MANQQGRPIGRYVLFGPIAAGGMASVHFGRLATDARFSRTVAIKRLHPQYSQSPDVVASLVDEARLASRIRHVNVVPILDVVVHEGETFLAMEYVAGESLAKLVKLCDTPAPLAIVSAILSGVLQGLHAAHEAVSETGEALGIVHRDVSPQNLLIGVDGLARVLDFGVAKARGRLMETTREGQIKGKLAYMAPEQLRAEQVDRAADVFAAGVVLWEFLTGRKLFSGTNEGQVLTSILFDPIVAPSTHRSECSVELDALVMKALAREAADRFSSAREFARALERAVPPASADRVADWLRAVAGESLQARASLLEEIERSTLGEERVLASAPDHAPGGASLEPLDRDAATQTDASIDAQQPSPTAAAKSGSKSWRITGAAVIAGVAVLSGAAAAFTLASDKKQKPRTTETAAEETLSNADPSARSQQNVQTGEPGVTVAPAPTTVPSESAPEEPPRGIPSGTSSAGPATPNTFKARPSATVPAPSAAPCKRVMGADGLWSIGPPGCKG